MYAVMGATGHVGSAVLDHLRDRGLPVLGITHDAAHAGDLAAKGVEAAVVDVHDADALCAAFRRCRRAFLLNPPADITTDTDAEERATVASILTAVEGSGLELVVAESTYGAQPGERCGDLNVLHGLEQGLKAQPVPALIQRAAYYMSNWDGMLEPIRTDGTMPTMIPGDLAMPMVAPADLGRNAARMLVEHAPNDDTVHVEGPARYSPAEVARAFASALDRDVALRVIPEDRWPETFREQGFSAAAAESYAKMTRVSVNAGFAMPDDPIRGPTTLQDYIDALVARGHD